MLDYWKAQAGTNDHESKLAVANQHLRDQMKIDKLRQLNRSLKRKQLVSGF